MPVYNSAGVKVTLATTSLKDSISATTSLSKTEGPPDLKRVNITLENNTTPLKEVAVVDDANPGPMRFLGSAGDAPYFLVQARDPAHTLSFRQFPPIRITSYKGRALKRALPLETHRALVLHVDLTKCTAWSRKQLHDRDMKIEVFLNGELCACRLISGQKSYDAWSCSSKVQIFAGRRVTRQYEHPWVLAQDSAATPSSPGPAHSNDLHSTWSIVSKRLSEEASLRGTNRYGDRSPVSDYLISLAESAPPALRSELMSSKPPGLIDVVISLGHGKKDPAGKGHLSAPTRMRGNGYPATTQSHDAGVLDLPPIKASGASPRPSSLLGGLGSESMNGARSDPETQQLTAPSRSLPSLGSMLQSETSSSRDLPPGDAVGMTRRQYRSMDPMLRPDPFTPFEVTDLLNQAASSPSSQSLAGQPVKPSRLDSLLPVIDTSSPTPSQAAPVNPSSPANPNPRCGWSTPAFALARRGITLPPKGVEERVTEVPITEAPSKRMSIDSILNAQVLSSPATQLSMSTEKMQERAADIVMPDAQPTGPTMSTRSRSRKSATVSTPETTSRELIMPQRPSKNDRDDRRNSNMDWEWTGITDTLESPIARRIDQRIENSLPIDLDMQSSSSKTIDLDNDSVFTFAKPEMVSKDGVLPDGRSEVLRQVRKERHGWFEEDSILCGVRFLML